MRVAVDAGHGGRDPGAVSGRFHEADIVQEVSLFLKGELLALGHRVRLIRSVTTSLRGRAETANTWGADRFVSLHCNAAFSPEPSGIETLFFPGSLAGEALAIHVQGALTDEFPGRVDRGIKERGDLAVLRLTAMPAVVVELEFMTNPQALKLLTSPRWQARAAKALAQGITEDIE